MTIERLKRLKAALEEVDTRGLGLLPIGKPASVGQSQTISGGTMTPRMSARVRLLRCLTVGSREMRSAMSKFPTTWRPQYKHEQLLGTVESIKDVGNSTVVNLADCTVLQVTGQPYQGGFPSSFCFWANQPIHKKWVSQLAVNEDVRLIYEGKGNYVDLFSLDVKREYIFKEKTYDVWRSLGGTFYSMKWMEHYWIKGVVDDIAYGKFTAVRLRTTGLDRVRVPVVDGIEYPLFSIDWSLAGLRKYPVEIGDFLEISKNPPKPKQSLSFTVKRDPGSWQAS